MQQPSASSFVPQIEHPHWTFFETIEKDLVEYSRYVEFHRDNFKTFSVNLTRLYLSICSEIDVVLKMICERVNQPGEGINHYRGVIVTKYPNLPILPVVFKRMGCAVQPWAEWRTTTSQNPPWWTKCSCYTHSF